jgi:CubicO group peptidase (beta-lactamase class C family)
LYSNWVFNVAGYIFEHEAHTNIYKEIQKQLVKPLKMQDWKFELQKKEGDSERSYYPAYPIWFSTRDMARIGLLMLNNGRWQDKQVIDSTWIKEMTKPIISYEEVNKNIPAFRGSDYYFGCGLYWWLWQNTDDHRFKGGYSALGAYGQSISTFPSIETVVMFKTNDLYERQTPYPARFRLLRLSVQCCQN